MATEQLYRIEYHPTCTFYDDGECINQTGEYACLCGSSNARHKKVPVEPCVHGNYARHIIDNDECIYDRAHEWCDGEADELCPNHKSAYLFNFKTWKSYCAHCGEEVERVSDGD